MQHEGQAYEETVCSFSGKERQRRSLAIDVWYIPLFLAVDASRRGDFTSRQQITLQIAKHVACYSSVWSSALTPTIVIRRTGCARFRVDGATNFPLCTKRAASECVEAEQQATVLRHEFNYSRAIQHNHD